MPEAGHLRIGELSRRVGVSPGLLRAWEQRYGLLRPTRSAGGYRLYSDADQARILRMQELQREGLSAAEAARLAVRTPSPSEPDDEPADAAGLARALERFDEAGAQAAFDRALASLSLDTLLRDVVLPYLSDLGRRWDEGTVTVAQEHFATNVLRGRLLGLARGWGGGRGPLAILACAPGEAHDLALVSFGLALRARGWRIAYLGTDTPLDTMAETAAAMDPALLVVAAASADRLDGRRDELVALAMTAPLALAGPGVDGALAESVGAFVVAGDPVSAAASLDSVT